MNCLINALMVSNMIKCVVMCVCLSNIVMNGHADFFFIPQERYSNYFLLHQGG